MRVAGKKTEGTSEGVKARVNVSEWFRDRLESNLEFRGEQLFRAAVVSTVSTEPTMVAYESCDQVYSSNCSVLQFGSARLRPIFRSRGNIEKVEPG